MKLLLNRRKLIAGSGEKYIKFKDPAVEAICIANWSSDGVGLTKEDAATVTSLRRIFNGKKNITSFEEFRFFTGVTTLTGGNNESNGEFGGCSVQSIFLPSTITTIGGCAFRNSGITSIDIPEGVTALQLFTFNGCKSLAYVKIPSTMTSFATQAFSGCSGLQTFVCLATVPPTPGTSVFYNVPSNCKFYVPYSADHSVLDAYKAAWTEKANQIFELDENGNIPN